MASSTKVSPSYCDNDEQPEMARLAPKMALLPFLVAVRCRCRLGILSSSLPKQRAYVTMALCKFLLG